ncbi:MAG: ABC transporter permease, partial [candidate division Zixibacteria bacterium]|nr:ABC transporter permease [candidate division Zixibacteria bacterium]
MLRNYLKVAYRNLGRHRAYSLINVFGLAMGLAACLLIMLWVQSELKYDRFHENRDSIYRVVKIWRKGEVSHYATTPAALAPALKEDFSDIRSSARFFPVSELLVASDSISCYERGVAFADPSFFGIFSFPLVSGDSANALFGPRSVLLTEKTASKYFGAQDPTGEVLRIADSLDFVVTGVIRDLPVTSHLQFDFLFPFAALGEEVTSDWHNTSYYSYLLLHEGV